MAYLNAKQRQELQDDLKNRSFRGAKWKLRWMDSDARLVFQRNNQTVGKWLTRFELKDAGVRVTLVETNSFNTHKNGKVSNDYVYSDAIVEPLPDNKS